MLGRRRNTLLGVALVVGLAACASGGGGDGIDAPEALEGRSGLTPTYAPETTSAGGSALTSTTIVATSTTGAPAGGASTTAVPGAPSSAITDPVGDATAGDGSAPGWADLVGARLTREPSHFELRVQLGEAAPSGSGSPDRTMNVASFFDVDGDGQVDYEIWANLSDGGWDGSWFDDRRDASALPDEAALDVLVEGGELVVRFPPEYVEGASAFRWSLASEYGSYLALGTQMTARDDAPDGDVAVAFPG